MSEYQKLPAVLTEEQVETLLLQAMREFRQLNDEYKPRNALMALRLSLVEVGRLLADHGLQLQHAAMMPGIVRIAPAKGSPDIHVWQGGEPSDRDVAAMQRQLDRAWATWDEEYGP